jgi:hypothetical protein
MEAMEMRNSRATIVILFILTAYTLISHGSTLSFVDLPLYFTILFLVALGLFFFITNIYILRQTGINTHELLITKYDYNLSHLFQLWLIFLTISIVSLKLFLSFQLYYGEETAEYIPLWTWFLLILLLVNPYPFLFHRERQAFLVSLSRIAFGSFSDAVPFCDVIFADILTSFSRVFGDLHWAVSDLILPLSFYQSNEISWMDVMSATMICLPFAFRFRQCVAEYKQSFDDLEKKRHLANAVKYLSAFPVCSVSLTP